MSIRDSASGSSDWRGGGDHRANGGGGTANGGLGGNARNGGEGARYGLTTGTATYGSGFGRPGGNVVGYATRQPDGSWGNFRTPTGSQVFAGNPSTHSGNSAMRGLGALQAAFNRPQAVSAQPVSGDTPVASLPPAVMPQQPVGAMPVKRVMGWLPSWPGTGQWWANEPRWNNAAPAPKLSSIPNGMRTDRFVGPNFSNSSRAWPTSTGAGPGFRSGDQWGPGLKGDPRQKAY